MSSPKSSARIEFPASQIDGDVRKLLEREGVRFKPQIFGPNAELDSPLYDLQTEVEDGIFYLHNPEACYGEFSDLEELLIEKGIPFDRRSSMDWNRSPELRIFRPTNEEKKTHCMDLHIDLDADADDPVVSVDAIREILKGKPEDSETGKADEVGLIAYKKIIDLMTYLDKQCPSYPPLTDYITVNEAAQATG